MHILITFFNSGVENKRSVLANSLEVLYGEFIVTAMTNTGLDNLTLNSG